MSAGRTPDTIVLVHGFWLTPRSWEHWITHYEAKGFKVLAPGYPGFEVEVEALNADPKPIVEHGAGDRRAARERRQAAARDTPTIIGHSAGGVFTQLLLDRGYGAAGVVLNSAPTEGVRVAPRDSVLANIKPGKQETWVDYHNGNRAPLLFVSGSEDDIMPPSVQKSNMKHCKGKTTEGPHFMPALEGWEKIADHALEWALEHARMPASAA